MKKWWLALFCLLVCNKWVYGDVSQTLRLHSKAYTTTEFVSLYDLLESANNLNVEQRNTLLQFPIIRKGYWKGRKKITLQRRQLVRGIRRPMKSLGFHVHVPSRISIIRISDREKIEMVATDLLLKRLNATRIKILSLTIPKIDSSQVQKHDWILKEVIQPGHFAIEIMDLVSKSAVGVVVGRFMAFGLVPVATRPLKFGHILEKKDIKIEERAVTEPAQKDKEQILALFIGQRMRSAKAIGQVLNHQDLVEEKWVKQGAWVTGIIQNKAWKVEMKLKAMSSGFKGEYVQLLYNNTPITGIVVDHGRVEILQ